MSFEFRPRPASVLASLLAAGLMLTVAGCGLTPLGPDAAATAPPPSPLRSPIVLQAMSVQPPAPAGGCPARFTMISVPGNPGECVRPLDTPVTITSAAVSSVSSFQPRTPSGQASGPPAYQIMITLPAADVTAATAVVTTAYDSRGGVDFSVAGRSWGLPMVFKPFRSQQLSIALPSKNQALQLHRLLVSSG
jgi:predicted small lipoprotein YifL